VIDECSVVDVAFFCSDDRFECGEAVRQKATVFSLVCFYVPFYAITIRKRFKPKNAVSVDSM
jgi:hypothetical protein